jgi:hypothetical protein
MRTHKQLSGADGMEDDHRNIDVEVKGILLKCGIENDDAKKIVKLLTSQHPPGPNEIYKYLHLFRR